ncbi:amidohydrolase [Pontimicrobium aquaticum]|uniref:Omega-amidase YafV n=1 Tax=Pontimicrobium aquaticum TaxID=2565367 RepID=A0A4U0F0T8_9FLAO|nr:amidohydrolase [Pontimicrobium aquaticum]TJY38035.1 amidohydrolase [Pontimicrobium aquaticum]
MQDTLKIALIQSDLVWEHPKENRLHFSEKIDTITETVDFILLPEMFTSGFTMTPENVFETMEGETVQWMKKLSKEKNAAIGGSLVIKEGGNFYNRFVFVTPNGTIDTYDKSHTFTLAGESDVYKAGCEKVIINYKGWKLCPLICYDLRFPVWARNVEHYDVLMYVANWPTPRVDAWDTLLKARAIENMSYCIGVNRVGSDANNLEYSGHSAAYDGLGKQLTSLENNKEGIEIVTLEKKHVSKIRTMLKFLDDKDVFTVK